MNILITGITGFIGKNFFKYSKFKNNVLAISREESVKRYKELDNLNFLNCDLKNINNFSNEIIEFNPECVINLAWGGIPDYSKSNSINNVEMNLKFFDFIINNTSIKKFINTGTCAEYYNPSGKISEDYIVKPYDDFSSAKINLSETLNDKCKELDINFINLRLFYVYGLYQRKQSLIPHIIDLYSKGIIPEITKPYTMLDFIFAEDVIGAIDSCLDNDIPSGSYNVGSGESIYNAAIQKLIAEKLDFKFDNNIYEKTLDEINFYADISKLSSLTNWAPKFKIIDGIQKILNEV